MTTAMADNRFRHPKAVLMFSCPSCNGSVLERVLFGRMRESFSYPIQSDDNGGLADALPDETVPEDGDVELVGFCCRNCGREWDDENAMWEDGALTVVGR